ncbi:MAG: aspartate ammonia-lyase [Actinobacteria bacterium]|nr:aspartate ammonia-lyase [Actinomycetota bacterium]
MSTVKTRTEKDQLGEVVLPENSLYGIHTARALENFHIAGTPSHPRLIQAYGQVKQACALVNQSVGALEQTKAEAIIQASGEMAAGSLTEFVQVDSLQGGAGTSLNMNVNEVIANRALVILGHKPGEYDIISPLDDVNKHQSTNDTYPTALKIAAIQLVRDLEESVVTLQESFQCKEKEFAHIVKVGRTQMQDAVLTTLGREFSAYAEAVSRDRWRIYKCEERLRVVNLGGTAIGTGLAAPKKFIFRVVDTLRELTGIGLARAENLIDATQNVDVFVEVSGILKALAATLLKISTDLRLLSSGPEAGLGEINLPARQAGSSIMPGKVNPVIPEAVSQAAMLVMGNDVVIAHAASMGSLELNPFQPLIAHCLLNNCDLLSRACGTLRVLCIDGIQANEDRCRRHVNSSTATATALVSKIGYDKVSELVRLAIEQKQTIRETAVKNGFVTKEEFNRLTSPEAVCKLGS